PPIGPCAAGFHPDRTPPQAPRQRLRPRPGLVRAAAGGGAAPRAGAWRSLLDHAYPEPLNCRLRFPQPVPQVGHRDGLWAGPADWSPQPDWARLAEAWLILLVIHSVGSRQSGLRGHYTTRKPSALPVPYPAFSLDGDTHGAAAVSTGATLDQRQRSRVGARHH